MEIEVKDTHLFKENLAEVMKHLLNLLREILATVHEERHVLQHDEMHKMQDVLNRREELLNIFNQYYKDFLKTIPSMNETCTNDFSLKEGLEWLHLHLDEEEVELLLLCDQLAGAGHEMQIETQELISLLEQKSAFGSHVNSYFTKITPKPVRVAVAVADEEDPECNPSSSEFQS